MIDAQKMKNGSMEVVNMNGILRDVVAVIVRSAIGGSPFAPSTFARLLPFPPLPAPPRPQPRLAGGRGDGAAGRHHRVGGQRGGPGRPRPGQYGSPRGGRGGGLLRQPPAPPPTFMPDLTAC